MADNDCENIIDAIEERLKQLEQEKDNIEKMYGINEDLIKEYSNHSTNNNNFNNQNNKSRFPSKLNTTNKLSQNFNTKNYYTNTTTPLPKLEIQTTKKDFKNSLYKTPESLQDSLKYEPSIKDLLDENDLEPSFSNLNNLKTNPFIAKSSNISVYINHINEDYISNYIN
jgi:hypothetical protein